MINLIHLLDESYTVYTYTPILIVKVFRKNENVFIPSTFTSAVAYQNVI